MTKQLPEKNLAGCLKRIRNMRHWAVTNNINPWTFRQALVMAIYIDTAGALARGVKPEQLQQFDATIKQDVIKWVEKH